MADVAVKTEPIMDDDIKIEFIRKTEDKQNDHQHLPARKTILSTDLECFERNYIEMDIKIEGTSIRPPFNILSNRNEVASHVESPEQFGNERTVGETTMYATTMDAVKTEPTMDDIEIEFIRKTEDTQNDHQHLPARKTILCTDLECLERNNIELDIKIEGTSIRPPFNILSNRNEVASHVESPGQFGNERTVGETMMDATMMDATTMDATTVARHDVRCESTTIRPCKVALQRIPNSDIPSAVHQDDATLKCFLCQYSATDVERLRVHIMNEHKYGVVDHRVAEKPSAKRAQKQVGPQNRILKSVQPVDRHSKNKGKTFESDVCTKAYNNESETLCFNVPAEATFACYICRRSIPTYVSLKAHLTRYHDNDRHFVCDKCSKTFASENALTIHKRTHNKIQFKCNVCGKRFTEETDLTEHRRVHLRKVHYSCSQCPKTFTKKEYLAIHERRHTFDEINRFSCDRCSKTFKYATSVKRHMLHAQCDNGKTFSCDECGKVMATVRTLYNHKLVHLKASKKM